MQKEKVLIRFAKWLQTSQVICLLAYRLTSSAWWILLSTGISVHPTILSWASLFLSIQLLVNTCAKQCPELYWYLEKFKIIVQICYILLPNNATIHDMFMTVCSFPNIRKELECISNWFYVNEGLRKYKTLLLNACSKNYLIRFAHSLATAVQHL